MFISRGWNPLSGNGPHPSPRFFLNVGSVLRQLEAFATIQFNKQGPGEQVLTIAQELKSWTRYHTETSSDTILIFPPCSNQELMLGSASAQNICST